MVVNKYNKIDDIPNLVNYNNNRYNIENKWFLINLLSDIINKILL